jgi:penicillin-binding protein 2
MLAGLADRHMDPAQSYQCPGYYTYGKKTFKCWFKKGHGTLSLIPALASSCNVYFYQLGLKIGPAAIGRIAGELGLGRKTGIDIPSEKSGLIPTVEWKKRKLRAPWQPGDTINMGIGQGPVWITPVQMAVMIAAVASRGRVYRPYIVERITDEDGADVAPVERPLPATARDIPDSAWDDLHRGLAEVVAWGTGRGCRLPGIAVAGKTGTAQNPHGKDHAWFVSYAPAANPELALAVIVENGGAGGAVAVPIARRVYEEYFRVHQVPVEKLPAPAEAVNESVEERPIDE